MPNRKLNDRQREAVEFVLASRDLAVNVQGAPGTGKTMLLQDVKRGLEQAGHPALALAPTKSAEVRADEGRILTM